MYTGFVNICILPLLYSLREDQSIITNPVDMYWPYGIYIYSPVIISLV